MSRIHPIAALLCLTSLAACEKNGVQELTAATPAARVKFFNFGVSAPGVNFFANDTKVTATSSVVCTPPTDPACSTTGIADTIGTTTGNAANAGFYAGLSAGQYTVTGRLASRSDNGVAIASLPVTLANGKAYSVYLSGIYNATAKSSDAFIVEDVFSDAIDNTVALVRFVNAISNSTPMVLYAKNTTTSTETAVGAVAAYKAGGAFVPLPAGIYDLNTRAEGSTTNVITRTAVSFAAGRVYTITARGDFTVTSSTAATRRQLDNTANR